MAATGTVAYQVRLSQAFLDEIDTMVYDLSSPGEKVSRSAVIRAAFRDYERKHSSTLEDCEPWVRGEPGEKPRKAVGAKFEQREAERLEAVAYELSTPKRDVTASDVLRASLRDYYEKHQGDVRECEPLNDGTLSPGGR